MNKDTIYTFTYAIVVCLVCSLLLSIAAIALKPLQEENVKLDKQKNILKAFALVDASADANVVAQKYKTYVQGFVIDQKGNIVDGLTPETLDIVKTCSVHPNDIAKNAKDCLLPVFKKIEDGKITGLAFGISGQGLWSRLLGYLALKSDANTVEGLSFYSQAETAGLGGEIAEEWFQKNFIGKKIYNTSNELVSVVVAKGEAKNASTPLEHTVDGISGATITANGVTDLLETTLRFYQPFLNKFRNGGNS
ncbi:MAG: NADH:ubiquinone reductase (Na(+)-transporting) subunit C [Candidatus Cloacimonadota bacterium]|nr:MAG: NADH:ubiquinone reductase (Na(+)-transporting) subunit C [Candidatus Cloacimonadota bacterium]